MFLRNRRGDSLFKTYKLKGHTAGTCTSDEGKKDERPNDRSVNGAESSKKNRHLVDHPRKQLGFRYRGVKKTGSQN